MQLYTAVHTLNSRKKKKNNSGYTGVYTSIFSSVGQVLHELTPAVTVNARSIVVVVVDVFTVVLMLLMLLTIDCR